MSRWLNCCAPDAGGGGMDLSEFDAISKSYGLANAILIVAVILLIRAARSLHRENELLHARLEGVLDQRAKALESLLVRANDSHP